MSRDFDGGPYVTDEDIQIVQAEAERRREQSTGLRRKFYVKRIGGTPGKHDDCFYFVLDPKHDPFAIPALAAYAEACRAEYPLLAADLDSITGHAPAAVEATGETQ